MLYRKHQVSQQCLINRQKAAFLEYLARLGYAFEPIDDFCLAYELSKEGKKMIVPLVADFNPAHAKQLFRDKVLTYRLLDRLGVSIPHGTYFTFDKFRPVDGLRSAVSNCNDLAFPIIVKPNDSLRSNGLTFVEVNDADRVEKALKTAAAISRLVIAQEFAFGRELRLFAVDGEIIFALEKFPRPDRPVERPPEQLKLFCDLEELQKIVKNVMDLSCARVCTFDTIVAAKGPIVLEVNTQPSVNDSLDVISPTTLDEYFKRLVQILWRY